MVVTLDGVRKAYLVHEFVYSDTGLIFRLTTLPISLSSSYPKVIV